MDLYVLRHGHVTRQEKNPGLSELGAAQAVYFGQWARDHLRVQKVLSSDLRRAAETSTILGVHLGRDVVFEPRLREYKSWAEPEDWQLFWQRVMALLHDTTRTAEGNAVLWVTHGGVFDLLMAQVLQLGQGQNMVTLTHHTGLSHFQATGKGKDTALQLVVHNTTPHLPDDWRTA